MNIAGFVVIAVLAIFVYIALHEKNTKVSEDKLEIQKEKYEEILAKFNVPPDHYKIVIGQSRAFEVYNCPAICWRRGGKVKLLLLSITPTLTDHDEEDFLFLASQPYVDFIRYDGTEYPEWARQSSYVKELFMPYVDITQSKGGIDYDKNMYWTGIICVYAKSMAEIFKMMNRPLADYDNKVDNKVIMAKDGSVPPDMLEEWKKTKAARKEAAQFMEKEEAKDTAATEGMEKAIQVIRDTERKAGEEAINSLYAKLLADKRFEDLEKATADAEVRRALLEEYNLNV